MSAIEVTDAVEEELASTDYQLVVLNYANLDMVGHTGIIEAAIKAVETVDRCVGRVVAAARRQGAHVIITADHGNAELMKDPDTKQPHTAHTTNQVPLILVSDKQVALRDGILADVAPTIGALRSGKAGRNDRIFVDQKGGVAMTVIEDVHGREILDSRGNPTVEVEVILADGSVGAQLCLRGVNGRL